MAQGLFALPDNAAPAPYFAMPRLSAMSVSPDERWYALEVEAPLAGRDARRIAVVRPGKPATLAGCPGSGATALAGDRLLYLAPARSGAPRTALWCRRLGGGEATEVVAPAGGVLGYAVAHATETAVIATVMHQVATLEDDARLRRQRAVFGSKAMLYRPGDLLGQRGEAGRIRLAYASLACGTTDVLPVPTGVHLTGGVVVAADASRVVSECIVDSGDAVRHGLLVAWQSASDREWAWHRLSADGDADLTDPVLSEDGRWLACTRTQRPAAGPPSGTLWLFDLADPTGNGRPLAPALDLWPAPAAWAPDGRLYFTADRCGGRPLYEIDVAAGTCRRLTAAGCFTAVQVRAAGLYAIRSAVDQMPVPVRLCLRRPPGTRGPIRLACPTPDPPLPGRLERINAGTGRQRVHGWLCRPDGAGAGSPAPLLVWLHGGPRSSWTGWSWRWCPWLATDRGYAVVMPDPAPSTGYGYGFMARAWADWAETPYADVMRLVDSVVARADIDGSRMAVLGSSFGGYLAYQIVTRTDRFRAAISHAGMWDLRTFVAGSLVARAFSVEFGHPLDAAATYAGQSPRTRARHIHTPLLVSHGSRDPVVPFTETLTLCSDLRHLGKPVTLLRFPDEAHELGKPANVQLWYQCVFAFLDQTLNGQPWRPPTLLSGT
ncbi:MAG: S9 family peptidase [Micromonosporaceae bacterium]|nr:S9 family peptidase [Micromonosporaceae bacterium]